MHLSEKFRIQGELPFVDVLTNADVAKFVDPYRIRHDLSLPEGPAARECLVSFTEKLISLHNADEIPDQSGVSALIKGLAEPSETHLGYTRAGVRGNGMGPRLGDLLSECLSSESNQLILIKRLEEMKVLVPRIGSDVLSDLTTRVVYGPLAHFTERMTREYPALADGAKRTVIPVWDADSQMWATVSYVLPHVQGQALVLVPITWAGDSLTYSEGQFYRRVSTEAIKREHAFALPTGDVKYPTKQWIYGRHPQVKRTNASQTVKYLAVGRDLLEEYGRFVDATQGFGLAGALRKAV